MQTQSVDLVHTYFCHPDFFIVQYFICSTLLFPHIVTQTGPHVYHYGKFFLRGGSHASGCSLLLHHGSPGSLWYHTTFCSNHFPAFLLLIVITKAKLCQGLIMFNAIPACSFHIFWWLSCINDTVFLHILICPIWIILWILLQVSYVLFGILHCSYFYLIFHLLANLFFPQYGMWRSLVCAYYMSIPSLSSMQLMYPDLALILAFVESWLLFMIMVLVPHFQWHRSAYYMTYQL